MNPLMRFSTANISNIGRGHKSHKNRLKEEGRYIECRKELSEMGLSQIQIKSLMRETEPISEQEIKLMLEMHKDLLEVRAGIQSVVFYGLLEFQGGNPNWLK